MEPRNEMEEMRTTVVLSYDMLPGGRVSSLYTNRGHYLWIADPVQKQDLMFGLSDFRFVDL